MDSVHSPMNATGRDKDMESLSEDIDHAPMYVTGDQTGPHMSTTNVDQMGYPIDQAISLTDTRYRKWLKAPWKIYIQNVRGQITEN